MACRGLCWRDRRMYMLRIDTLLRMADASGADEIMAMTNIHDHDERKRSYDRVARALD